MTSKHLKLYFGQLNVPLVLLWKQRCNLVKIRGGKLGADFLKSSENGQVKNETYSLLKKTDLFLWILELCCPILVLTRFLKILNFRWGKQTGVWGKG